MLLLIQAIVLGLIQGLTEFLPVSSSGHLQAVPFLLGWDSGSLGFDVMVHLGTLLAVLTHFRHDLWQMGTRALGIGEVDAGQRRDALVLIGLLALGTLPAVVAALLFADTFEAAFSSPRAVAGFLYLTAVLLWGAEVIRRRRLDAVATGRLATPERAGGTDRAGGPDRAGAPDRVDGGGFAGGADLADGAELAGGGGLAEGTDLDPGRDIPSIRGRDALLIGVAQALAIFPGVSRAGSTMAAGMSVGLSRTAAARFSFLLSIPVILGATVFTLADLGTQEAGTLPFGPLELAVGVLVAAVSGYWAIRFLLQLLSRRDLLVFAKYVAVFATVLLIATFVA